MSRYIQALTGYNKNNKGKVIWFRATTQSNLVMDSLQRILFDEVLEYGYKIVTPKEIKNNLESYKPFMNCFNSKTKEDIINSINELIFKVEKYKIKYILFKMG